MLISLIFYFYRFRRSVSLSMLVSAVGNRFRKKIKRRLTKPDTDTIHENETERRERNAAVQSYDRWVLYYSANNRYYHNHHLKIMEFISLSIFPAFITVPSSIFIHIPHRRIILRTWWWLRWLLWRLLWGWARIRWYSKIITAPLTNLCIKMNWPSACRTHSGRRHCIPGVDSIRGECPLLRTCECQYEKYQTDNAQGYSDYTCDTTCKITKYDQYYGADPRYDPDHQVIVSHKVPRE